jgi:hypothetical protein
MNHIVRDKPRLAKERAELAQQHLENSGVASGRTTKQVVMQRATDRPSLTTDELISARKRLIGKKRDDTALYKAKRHQRVKESTAATLAQLRVSKQNHKKIEYLP